MNISGATGSTYLLVNADVGTVITVTSTATNVGGSDSLTSAATATISAAGAGTARSAPTITRTTGATTYPPTVDFTRPSDWADGDLAVMQWSADYTFGTGVSETTTPQTITAAVTTYDFGLSAITSGSRYIRMAAWTGARPGSLTWSNLINVGDVVAPTLNSGTTSSAENAPMAVAVTSNEPAYLTLGGADAALLEIVPSSGLLTAATVRLIGNANLNYEAKTSFAFNVIGTDPAGNVGTGAFTHNVTNQVENPSGMASRRSPVQPRRPSTPRTPTPWRGFRPVMPRRSSSAARAGTRRMAPPRLPRPAPWSMATRWRSRSHVFRFAQHVRFRHADCRWRDHARVCKLLGYDRRQSQHGHHLGSRAARISTRRLSNSNRTLNHTFPANETVWSGSRSTTAKGGDRVVEFTYGGSADNLAIGFCQSAYVATGPMLPALSVPSLAFHYDGGIGYGGTDRSDRVQPRLCPRGCYRYC